MELALLLVLACAGRIGAQEPEAGKTTEDLSKLSLDEVIDRLPPIGEEWLPGATEDDDGTRVPALAEFQTRIERGDPFTAEQWKHALLSTGVLRIRDRWPVDVPFAVSMREPGWLSETSIRLTPAADGLPAVELRNMNTVWECGNALFAAEAAALYQELGPLPLGRIHLTLDASFEREKFQSPHPWDRDAPDPPHPPGGVFWTGPLDFDVEVVDSIDAAIPPVSSASIDDAVRRSLSLDAEHGWLFADPNPCTAELAGLALSLAVDVLEDGIVRESFALLPSSSIWTDDSSCVHGAPQHAMTARSIHHGPPPGGGADERLHWSLHVRGTSVQVLRLWHAKERWSGELTISFDELITREHELAPTGRECWRER